MTVPRSLRNPLIRAFAIVAGGALIGFGLLQFAETKKLGFPDGHISDVARVLIPYDYALAVLAIILGLSAWGLALRNAKKIAVVAWFVALFFGVAMFVARPLYAAYLATFLATSAGG